MLGASQSPDTTIAIVLGASRWPKAPKLSAPPSFAKSAAAFLAYLRSEEGFQLLNENLLNLFDTEDSPSGVVERISEFLIERKAAL